MGALGVLGLIFLVLKLVGVIDWSWFWVLFPWILDVILSIIYVIAKK